jgi:photosystem II stability/assembly factor-like uncharacterized protein
MKSLKYRALLLIACMLTASAASAQIAPPPDRQPQQEVDGWRKLTVQKKISQFSFPTGGRWWAASIYNVHYSEDEGGTWTEIPAPVEPSDLAGGHHFFSRDLGYAFSPGGSFPARFHRTTNAGESWVVTDPGFGPLERLQMFDAASGVISSDNEVSFTFDSGRTWRKHFMLPANTNDVRFANPKVGYAVGPSTKWFDQYPQAAVFQRTLDSGKNWEMIYTGVDEGWRRVYTISEDTLIVLASQGRVHKSTDKGSTWTLSSVEPGGQSINDISFITNRYALAVANAGRIYITEDAGSSWKLLTAVGQGRWTSIDFADSLIGFISGDDGVWRTTSGGKAWVQLTLPPRISLQTFPEPFRTSVSFRFSLEKPCATKLEIFTLEGKQVAEHTSSELRTGEVTITLATADWSPGVYLYRLTACNGTTTGRITLSPLP